MESNHYLNIIKDILIKGEHVCLGYNITEKQFLGIAEAYAHHISKYGWNWYLAEMAKWQLRIIDYVEFKKNKEYHIVSQITCDMATIGANCKCKK